MPKTSSTTLQRIVAIDALRGFDMFWIVGGRELALAIASLWGQPLPPWVEYHLNHPAWLGFSAWDLIMPLFLFVVGAAMPFSLTQRMEQGVTRSSLMLKIIRRSILLFLIGMILQGNVLKFDLGTLDIYCNTLQAIGVGYLVAGILLLTVSIPTQIAFSVVMLLGYWAIINFSSLTDSSRGALLPDKNVALAIDVFCLGNFRDGSAHTWILTGMSFAAMVLLGVFAGHILRSGRKPVTCWWLLVALSGACLVTGWLWSTVGGYPLIKHIWTGSMVLWAAGWCYLLLASFYLLIDIWGWKRWAFPFVVVGMNAITIYVASWFVPFRSIAESLVGGLSRHLASFGPVLIESTSILLVWLILYHLYSQRIFLRL